MLLVFLLGILYKRKIAAIQKYSLALLTVLLWDPFAVLSIGFWLSFVAVGALLYAYSNRRQLSDRKNILSRFMHPQLVINLGLLPCTLLFFSKTAMLASVINLLAIPWVCFLVLPFAMLGSLVLVINQAIGLGLLTFAETNFSYLWVFLKYCGQLPVYLWQTPQQYLYVYLAIATIGSLWLFIPRGIPGRYWGLITLVLLFCTRVDTLGFAQAEFSLLDVGQGLSAVIRTQNHVLVYDTGARLGENFDLGSQVVAPYLQTIGVKHITKLLISHADNDHIGGAVGLMSKLKVEELILNDAEQLSEHKRSACLAGQSWTWDGVDFKILHPTFYQATKKRNDQSCVLMVQAGDKKVLLTGDIETKAENSLITTYGSNLKADLLIVPHHGSKTSSSLEFLQAVQPEFALIPVGYRSQYGHPKPEIIARYQQLGIHILRTDLDGALIFKLGTGINAPARCFRREHNKFWLAKS
jgi:competence protein ComEC